MNSFKKIMTLAVSAVLATAALAGCSGNNVAYEDATDATEAGINVTVASAEIRDIETTVTYTGEMVAGDIAYVTGKASAKVTSINADLGDWVDEGDVLVRLDDTDYAFQLSQARAAYNQADAAYQSAIVARDNVDGVNKQAELQLSQAVNASQIAYNDAKLNYERQSELYKKGSVSLVAYESAKSAYENATLAYESAKANYDINVSILADGNKKSADSAVATAKAARDSAQLAVKQAETLLDNTVIEAPISGYISSKNVALGQFASAGMALFTISDTRSLEIEIKVTEAVVSHLEVGGKATVSVPSANVTDADGRVCLVNPVKDAVSGMYIVRVSVPNEDNMLKVGMFADVALTTTESEEDALSIPTRAIVQTEEGNYVFVLNGNLAEKVWVECGAEDDEFTSITEGLEEGDVVVCDGKDYISEENNAVNIVE
ncbi:MAG: efflux RND transporter periplasmic adaptor subunit [Clostridia bacterium]|nr:efflux RND transporter periplasmic adaptor subunit [Clostridia bacterium]